MMMPWIAYGLVVSLLIFGAALALEQVVLMARRPIRMVWAAALLFAVCVTSVAPARSVLFPGSRFQPGHGQPVRGLEFESIPEQLEPESFEVESSEALTETRQLGEGAASSLKRRWEDLLLRIERGVPSGLAAREVNLVLKGVWGSLATGILLFIAATVAESRRVRRKLPRASIDGNAVLLSPDQGPAVVGIFHPQIVVPNWFVDRSEADQRLAIAHEKEHIAARDPQLVFAAWLMVACLAWNPFLWWMLGRLRLATEMDCDSRVLRAGVRRRAYGAFLVDLAEQRLRGPAGALSLAGTRSHLERRLLNMTNTDGRLLNLRMAGSLALACLLLVAACETTPPAGSGFGRVSLADLPTITTQEEIRLGTGDDPQTTLTRVSGVRVAPDGRLYILDSRRREVLVFDENGRFLKTIGKPGPGPGEFESASLMGIVGDTLWVMQASHRRFSLFDLEGAFLGTAVRAGVIVPIGIPDMRVEVVPYDLMADGNFSSTPQVGVTGYSVPGSGFPDSTSVPAYVFDLNGEVVDTLGHHPIGGRSSDILVFGGLVSSTPMELQGRPHRLPYGRELIVVDRPTADPAGEFSVVRLDENQDTTYRLRVEYPPMPIPTSTIDSLIAAQTGMPSHGGPPPRSYATALREALSSYRYFPPVNRASLGADGDVWLELTQSGADTADWMLIDGDGRPRGIVRLPKRAAVSWSAGDLVWVTEMDELDVPTVVRYRLR